MLGEIIKMHKNKFLTFLFSIIPGCGHMYLGYMKRGAEFMAMFAAAFYFMILFMNLWHRLFDTIGTIFVIMLPVIWLYQIFDSMHTIAQMRRLGIEVPLDDEFFIPGVSNISNLNALNVFKKRKVIKGFASILMCVGVYVLFTNIINGVFGILRNSASAYMRIQYQNIYITIMDYTPPAIISLLLIFAGIKLLKGKDNGVHNNKLENYQAENNGNGGDEL
jgi:hypothetical protein